MPELTIIPFLSCILTVALVYKYLTPRLTDGNVVFKEDSLQSFTVFSFLYSLVFTMLSCPISIGIALAITPLVRDFVNNAEYGVYTAVSAVLKCLIFQSIFFVMSLCAGKYWKDTFIVNGKLNAWKAAWAPALVVIILVVVFSAILQRFAIASY